MLNRFASNHLIAIHDIKTGLIKHKTAKEIGYINTSSDLFNDSEKRWSVIETRGAKALRELDSGNLLKNSVGIKAIKQYMALHFIRSFAFVELSSIREKEEFSNLLYNLTSKHGIIIKDIQKFRLEWIRGYQKNIPEILLNVEKKIFDFIDKYDLEIGEADESSEIVLSDNPVLNMTKDGLVGLRQGVAFDQSDSVVITLGPKHIAALITKNPIDRYIKLNSTQVTNYNKHAITYSLREFYTKPSI